METKDKIIIFLTIITIILMVPNAMKAIHDLHNPQTSPSEINQENSTNNNTHDITNSNVSNSAIGSDSINNNGNDSIVGNNNSKTTYYVNTPSTTPTPSVPFTPEKLPTYNNSIGIEFVQIPSGSYMMGDDIYYENNDEINKEWGFELYPDKPESPKHKVVINYSFYLGKYDVTCKQWNYTMGSSKTSAYLKGDDYPVANVNWDDIQEFISKLNEKEHTNKYRLPSESEWEYTCRAGTTTDYFFGNDPSDLDEYAWYVGNSLNSLNKVGQKKPNPWGLYDMIGNIYQTVQDAYYGDYKDAPCDGSARGNGSYVEERRGGCGVSYADKCKSASRSFFDSTKSNDEGTYNLNGFRIVKEV